MVSKSVVFISFRLQNLQEREIDELDEEVNEAELLGLS